MARSRNIKPGFFSNEDLVELDFATRLLFAGLWTVADRARRLQDRPKKIKIDVFPADSLNVDAILQSLHDAKFIIRYEVDGTKYIQVTNWAKHQNPHHTENWSKIPDLNGFVTVKPPIEPRDSQEEHGGNLADSLLLIPDSLIPEKKMRKARTAPKDVSLSEYLVQCKADGRKATQSTPTAPTLASGPTCLSLHGWSLRTATSQTRKQSATSIGPWLSRIV